MKRKTVESNESNKGDDDTKETLRKCELKIFTVHDNSRRQGHVKVTIREGHEKYIMHAS